MSEPDTDISELICTCTEFDAAFYHDGECELWQDADFQAGIAYWDGFTLQNVPIDANPDDFTTIRDWQTLARMDSLGEPDEDDDENDPLDELFDEWEQLNASHGMGGITVFSSSVKPTGTGGYSWEGGGTYVGKCRHYGQEVLLPDGTPIICSSQHDRKTDDDNPDFGCYMASSWRPKWISFHLEWPDYQIPAIPHDQLLWTLDHLLEYARGGRKVEIGCIGGHGRTGSLLALLLIRGCGLTANDAAWYVWENYCTEAIEGKKQLWFLSAFDAQLRGLPIPEMPQEPCAMWEHKKLWEKGELCMRPICHTPGSGSHKDETAWEEDFADFMKPKKVYDWVKGVKSERIEYPKIHANWLV